VGRYDSKPDFRQLLRERGLTIAAAGRKARLAIPLTLSAR
jgi:hypothetical protein